MEMLSKEIHDQLIIKISEWLANEIFSGVFSFVLSVQDGEGGTHILHSDKQEIPTLAELAAWASVQIMMGLKQNKNE